MDIKRGFRNLKIKNFLKIVLYSFSVLCLVVSNCLTNLLWLKLVDICFIVVNTIYSTKSAIDLIHIYKTQKELQKLIVESLKRGD